MYKRYSSGNKQPKTWLTIEEYQKLILNRYLPRKDDLIIQLLYSGALRVSELTNIKVGDIDIENATICIQESKTSNQPALVPVPIPVLKLVNQWVIDNKLSANRHLFFSSHKNRISRTLVHNLIKKATRNAGIKKEVTSHTFRRSRATHLLDSGLPIEQVSKLLRHKNITSTLIYLQISIKGLQEAIHKIDSELLQ